MVALDQPLNPRQLETLQWIGQGCPPRSWPDSTFKTVAVALQNRRLIVISKKSGRWNASILDAGRHYLTHGTYPPGHRKKPPGPGATNNPGSSPQARASKPRPESPAPRREHPASEDDAPAPTPASRPLPPTRQLLRDVVAAGGELTRDTTDDDTNYAGFVAAINRRKMAPAGQELVMERAAGPREWIFRLEDLPAWRTTPVQDIVDAPRISRWHPAIAELRSDGRATVFGSDVRTRALRILHSLAT
ncbi:hypothetical protein [Speluncibacter jeojiensis]|uniref:Uncharacterized protein n=1 Tax=Speluncibacter jeojiensis TaxID=2710754 RepID=A0A9X4RF25_9ACTN|nr:hypothetical protein [Corynebacteriales bacterium D3-21]